MILVKYAPLPDAGLGKFEYRNGKWVLVNTRYSDAPDNLIPQYSWEMEDEAPRSRASVGLTIGLAIGLVFFGLLLFTASVLCGWPPW